VDSTLYEYFKDQLVELIKIDSVSSDYSDIQNYISTVVKKFGYEIQYLNKGGIVINLGGEGDPIVVTAHADTIGLMVRSINSDGTLQVTNVGRMPEYAVENENVVIKNYKGQKFTGTIRRKWSCIHVTPLELRNASASYDDNLELQLDCDVNSESEVRNLGIDCGDIVAIEPRLSFTDGGFIKSFYLDDKVNIAILFAYMKYLEDIKVTRGFNVLKRKQYIFFSMHEEVMHGGAVGVPQDAKEILALDVSCVCLGQQSTEKAVTICQMDSRFPYNREMINKLIEIANENKINYRRDIFIPTYGTDADIALLAGHDIKHALIGPGVVGTHGYERTHKLGICNTFDLITKYLGV